MIVNIEHMSGIKGIQIAKGLPLEILQRVINISLQRWFNISEILQFILDNYDVLDTDPFMRLVSLKNIELTLFFDDSLRFGYKFCGFDTIKLNNERALKFEELLKNGRLSISRICVYKNVKHLLFLLKYSPLNHFPDYVEIPHIALKQPLHKDINIEEEYLRDIPQILKNTRGDNQFTFHIQKFDEPENISDLSELVLFLNSLSDTRAEYEITFGLISTSESLSPSSVYGLTTMLKKYETPRVKFNLMLSNIPLENKFPKYITEFSCYGLSPSGRPIDLNWKMGDQAIFRYDGDLLTISEYMQNLNLRGLLDYIQSVNIFINSDRMEELRCHKYLLPFNVNTLTLIYDEKDETVVDLSFLDVDGKTYLNTLRIVKPSCPTVRVINIKHLQDRIKNLILAMGEHPDRKWEFLDRDLGLDNIYSNVPMVGKALPHDSPLIQNRFISMIHLD